MFLLERPFDTKICQVFSFSPFSQVFWCICSHLVRFEHVAGILPFARTQREILFFLLVTSYRNMYYVQLCSSSYPVCAKLTVLESKNRASHLCFFSLPANQDFEFLFLIIDLYKCYFILYMKSTILRLISYKSAHQRTDRIISRSSI